MPDTEFTEYEQKVIDALPKRRFAAKSLSKLREKVYGSWTGYTESAGQRAAISAAIGRINRKRQRTIGWTYNAMIGETYYYR